MVILLRSTAAGAMSQLSSVAVCSMERLFDLMCGGVKLMLCTINSAEELITGTVAHLDGVMQLLKQIGPGSKSCEQRRIAALQLVEASKARVSATYFDDAWTESHVDMLRTELLNFFINCRVKVNETYSELS
jgi:Organic solute transport protein 1